MLKETVTEGTPGKSVYAAVIVILAAALSLHAIVYWGWTEDDAYISYRYAENMLDGRGMVFNEGERVEGYSNFLWVMITAAGMRTGFNPEAFSKTIGIAAAIAAMFLSWLIAARLCPRNRVIPFLAPLYIAATPFLTRHAVSGLETAFFAAVLSGAVLSAGSGRKRMQRIILILLLVILALTRVEGPVLAVLILAGRLMPKKGAGPKERLRGTLLFELLPFLIIFGAYYSWRWIYFGDPVANTFYAKINPGVGSVLSGGRYTAEFIRDSGGALFIGLAAVPVLFRKGSNLFRLCALVTVFYTIFIIISGGDWMFNYRFYAHILPVLLPMIAAGAAWIVGLRSSGNVSSRALAAVASAALAGVFLVTAAAERRIAGLVLPAVRNNNYLSQNYRELAEWFRDNTARDATVAISDVGAFSYFSGRRVLDLFELVTRGFSRAAGHAGCSSASEYVLACKPEYVVLISRITLTGDKVFIRKNDLQVHSSAEFHESYSLIKQIPQNWNYETANIYLLGNRAD